VFPLVLCAFALGGCALRDALFPEEDPLRLIIKNESYEEIVSVEFWDASPLASQGMSEEELMQTPPLLKDTAVISYECCRSWTLDTGKRYAVRINGKLFPVFLSDTEDTVYVFNSAGLIKKRHDYRSAGLNTASGVENGVLLRKTPCLYPAACIPPKGSQHRKRC
jgi:hypothetical protein